jgi:hypothetical protein
VFRWRGLIELTFLYFCPPFFCCVFIVPIHLAFFFNNHYSQICFYLFYKLMQEIYTSRIRFMDGIVGPGICVGMEVGTILCSPTLILIGAS